MKKILFLISALWAGHVSAEIYVGADLQMRHITFKHFRHITAGQTNHVRSENINQKTPQLNIFAAYKFHKNFSLELGSHMGKSKAVKNASAQHDIKGVHTTLMLHLPVKSNNVLLGVGLSRLHSVFRSSMGRLPHRKTVPRFLIGVEAPLMNDINIRLSMITEKVSSIGEEGKDRIVTQGTFGPDIERKTGLQLRDTFIFGMGLYYKF